MAFRRRKPNPREWWLSACRRESALISEIGLPAEVFASEHAFKTFVTTGRLEGTSVRLDALPRDRIMLLFHFATDHYDYNAVEFTALQALRVRRDPLA